MKGEKGNWNKVRMPFMFLVLCCLFYGMYLSGFSCLQVTEKNDPRGFKQKQNPCSVITEEFKDTYLGSHRVPGMELLFLTSVLLVAGPVSKHCCLLWSQDVSSSSRPHSNLLGRSNYHFLELPAKTSLSLIACIWIMHSHPNQLRWPEEKPCFSSRSRLCHKPIPQAKDTINPTLIL